MSNGKESDKDTAGCGVYERMFYVFIPYKSAITLHVCVCVCVYIGSVRKKGSASIWYIYAWLPL